MMTNAVARIASTEKSVISIVRFAVAPDSRLAAWEGKIYIGC